MLPCVKPAATRFAGAEGGVVSRQAFVDALMVVSADRLPAASNASTERLYVFPQLSPDTVPIVVAVEPADAAVSYMS